MCGRASAGTFLELRGVPVQCNVQWADRAAALAAPRGNITLAFCAGCGMIWNTAFDAGRVQYDERYENSLHYSPRFQEYARCLAVRLVERYSLYGTDIIEIGCGQGEFLRLLCEAGGNRGLGFDPGYRGPDAAPAGASGSVTFVRDIFRVDDRAVDRDGRAEARVGYSPRLICCRHVLEHLADPRGFLAGLRQVAASWDGAALYFEVPNALSTLRDLGIWDILYEHCSYFCAVALTRLFEESGFAVQGVYEAFGGQYLGLEARVETGSRAGKSWTHREMAALEKLVEAFGAHYRSKVAAWDERLCALAGRGSRVVLWGAGSKGVMFLNSVPASRSIAYVVDINPRKQGRYVAGSGQQIVAPAFLTEYRPDAVLVANPLYEEEIRQSLRWMGLQAGVVAI